MSSLVDSEGFQALLGSTTILSDEERKAAVSNTVVVLRVVATSINYTHTS